MTTSSELSFKRNYDTHLKHLRLKGLQPKTIDAYSGAILSGEAWEKLTADDADVRR